MYDYKNCIFNLIDQMKFFEIELRYKRNAINQFYFFFFVSCIYSKIDKEIMRRFFAKDAYQKDFSIKLTVKNAIENL